MITENMKMSEILKFPEFRNKEYMVCPVEGSSAAFFMNSTLSQLHNAIPTWNVESMAKGLNYLQQEAGKRHVFFDIWPADERRKDITKKMTGIAAFPLEKKSKYILLCAGGAYENVSSMVEAYPLVERIQKLGYAVFVLQYRCGTSALFPNPMEDAAQAVRFIAGHAEQFKVIPDSYAIAGFSAGGHLAASMGTGGLGYKKYGIPKPESLFLSYPLIQIDDDMAKLCKNIFGKDTGALQELQKQYTITEHITGEYPPCFVWQCEEDDTVPFENSRQLVRILEKNKVPCKFESYPGTDHGWGAGDGTMAEGWIARALQFWEMYRQ